MLSDYFFYFTIGDTSVKFHGMYIEGGRYGMPYGGQLGFVAYDDKPAVSPVIYIRYKIMKQISAAENIIFIGTVGKH